MKFLRTCWLLLGLLLLSGCVEYDETTVETGYRGIARVNPWLAAQRFLQSYDIPVRTLTTWKEPEADEAVWILPAETLSNEVFVRSVSRWVTNGGHLVCLVENASSFTDDWQRVPQNAGKIEEPCLRFLASAGFELEEKDVTATEVKVQGRGHEVKAASHWSVSRNGGEALVFSTASFGNGRISVVTDARPFRNRNIDSKEHAAWLRDLVVNLSRPGAVVFVRGATLSLGSLLVSRAWPVLIGLAVVLVIWLWKTLPRFGPLEPADPPSPLRGYDHHLEALGDFHWRLDRGIALLAPIREEVLERFHRFQSRSGQHGGDIFAVLSQRSGVSRERVQRALSEPAPADAAVFSRTVADLQRLLESLS